MDLSKNSYKKIKVSIITPTFNSSKYIKSTIDSVLAQTHENWEWLLTDDCSTDNTIDILRDYIACDDRIKFFQLQENSGPGIARNNSIYAASGDVIAFLDADDLWDSDFLEKSLRFMEEYKAPIVFSSYRRYSEELNEDFGAFIVPEKTNYDDMLKSCAISCLTGMYNIERCNGKAFMPDIRKRQDYCLWLTLLKRVDYAYGIKDVMATYRIRKGSVSRNKFKTAMYQWYVYREVEKLSLVKSCYFFINYALKGVMKNYSTILNKSIFVK